MATNFCTLFDKGFISKGMVLINSIRETHKDYSIFIVALDEYTFDFLTRLSDSNINLVKLSAVENEYNYLKEIKKTRRKGDYYLTLKPHCIDYIITNYQFLDHLAYVDSDMMFFSTLNPVLQELADKSILVTSHNFSKEHIDKELYGKFNGGFLLVKNNETSISCLNWWCERCTEWCFDYIEGDKFTDQKYMEKFPILYPNEVVVSKLIGLNLAGYNIGNCDIAIKNNQIICNGEPLILFHYCSLKKNNVLNFYILSIWDYTVYKNIKIIDSIFGKYLIEVEKVRRMFKLSVLNERSNIKFFSKDTYHQLINLDFIYMVFLNKCRIVKLSKMTRFYRYLIHDILFKRTKSYNHSAS